MLRRAGAKEERPPGAGIAAAWRARSVTDCLRIFEWEIHFENSRTRELRTMSWVPVPNKHDGDGFTQLASHPDGPSHFGVWNVLLQVASKCNPRGTLVRQGRHGQKTPHDAESISRITRFPVAAIDAAIARLLEIGWLETFSLENCLKEPQKADAATLSPVVATTPQHVATTPRGDAALRARAGAHSQNGKNGKNGTEGTEDTVSASAREPREEDLASGFDRLLAVYPRKTDLPNAQRAYIAVFHELPPEGVLLANVRANAASAEWTREGGRYCPKLENWLNRRGWKEPVPLPAKNSVSQPQRDQYRRIDDAAGFDPSAD